MKDTEIFNETFDKFKTILDAKKYEEANTLMETYLKDDTKSLGDIKTVLVITKSFKTNEHMCDTRKKLVALLEDKLGQKLI